MVTVESLKQELEKTAMLEKAGVGGGIPGEILGLAIVGVGVVPLLEVVESYLKVEPENHPALFVAYEKLKSEMTGSWI